MKLKQTVKTCALAAFINASLAANAFAQSNPFESIEEAGNTFIDLVKPILILLCTIAFIGGGVMAFMGRISWAIFGRISAAALLIGAAPSLAEWLFSFF